MGRTCAAVMAVFFAATMASAVDTVQIQIGQATASASIQLQPDFAVEFTLTFEQVSGLTAQNLGLSAGLVDPANVALLARLPHGASIPAAFPVLIAVEPPSTGSFSFDGVVAISLHTTNLSWTPGTPLRLLAAPLGGSFEDITSSTGSGSYRVGANKGGFSEFLVVSDLRTVDAVIAEKFERLRSTLARYSQTIPASVRASLQAQLDAAQASYGENDPAGAAEKIGTFATTVQQHAGAEIPNVWRASRDTSNVAGELRAGAATLKYSLLLTADSGL